MADYFYYWAPEKGQKWIPSSCPRTSKMALQAFGWVSTLLVGADLQLRRLPPSLPFCYIGTAAHLQVHVLPQVVGWDPDIKERTWHTKGFIWIIRLEQKAFRSRYSISLCLTKNYSLGMFLDVNGPRFLLPCEFTLRLSRGFRGLPLDICLSCVCLEATLGAKLPLSA